MVSGRSVPAHVKFGISLEQESIEPLEECVTTATPSHPEILGARAEVDKAEAALRLAEVEAP